MTTIAHRVRELNERILLQDTYVVCGLQHLKVDCDKLAMYILNPGATPRNQNKEIQFIRYLWRKWNKKNTTNSKEKRSKRQMGQIRNK